MSAQASRTGEDRAHIRLLGRLLGEVIREQQGPEAYLLVEDIRRQSVGEYRAGERGIEKLLTPLSQADTFLLIRAFSIFSQLANIADDHVLRRQTRVLGTGAMQRLEQYDALPMDKAAAFLKEALLVPVITAHPTEVRRKSVLDREEELSELLEAREQAGATATEVAEIDARLERAIRILWQTRMLRGVRIDVTDEIENNIAVFARTFLPKVGPHLPGKSWLYDKLGVTRGRRSLYDELMLSLHDAGKLDTDFQQNSPHQPIEFPSGSCWLVFTDQVLHAALGGEFALEQTFHLDVSEMAEPERAPIKVLERLSGKALA